MSDSAPNPGARMYEEFVAIHAVLRRGTRLVADSYGRLADGHAVDSGALAEAARWLLAFTHAHHRAEDDLFWPVLLELYPHAERDLKTLSEDHVALDRALGELEAQVARLGTPGADAGAGTRAARRVQEILAGHLDGEESVVEGLFPGVPGPDIDRLREAFVQGSPRFGLHLMFGLLEDPEPARGHDLLTGNFPPALRAAREQLLRQYREGKRALVGGS